MILNKMVNDYLRKPELFVFPFVLKEKSREIITYQKNSHGNALRKYHEALLGALDEQSSSASSFAYKKGLSTKDAITKHLKSNLFIKMDIHHFFESITFDQFIQLVAFPIGKISQKEIQSCFYHQHLSIGFVTSPKISDMFMYSFDLAVEQFLSAFPKLCYSRYCDDILISSQDSDFGDLHALYHFIESRLADLHLTVNEKKYREFDLSSVTSVSFLGLNISKAEPINKVTIGKPFILKTLTLLERAYNLLCQYQTDKTLLRERFHSIKQNRLSSQDSYYIETMLMQKKHLKDRKTFLYLKSVIKSRVAYMRFHSETTYLRFKAKHQNKFGFAWGTLWLSFDQNTSTSEA